MDSLAARSNSLGCVEAASTISRLFLRPPGISLAAVVSESQTLRGCYRLLHIRALKNKIKGAGAGSLLHGQRRDMSTKKTHAVACVIHKDGMVLYIF